MKNAKAAKGAQALQTSENDLVNQIVEKYTPRIEAIVNSKLRPYFRDPHLPGGVTGSVVVSLLEHHREEIAQFTGSEEGFWQLFGAIALRHCDKHKHRIVRAKPKVPIGRSAYDSRRGGFEPVDSGKSPSSIVRDKELDALRKEFIKSCKQPLTDRQKAILAQRYDGRTSEQIATALNIAIPTVNREWKNIKTILAALESKLPT
jgi:hypothetical protein